MSDKTGSQPTTIQKLRHERDTLLRQRESLKHALRRLGAEQKSLRTKVKRLNIELETARALLGLGNEAEGDGSHPPPQSSRHTPVSAVESGFVSLLRRPPAPARAKGPDQRTIDTVPPPRTQRAAGGSKNDPDGR